MSSWTRTLRGETHRQGSSFAQKTVSRGGEEMKCENSRQRDIRGPTESGKSGPDKLRVTCNDLRSLILGKDGPAHSTREVGINRGRKVILKKGGNAWSQPQLPSAEFVGTINKVDAGRRRTTSCCNDA